MPESPHPDFVELRIEPPGNKTEVPVGVLTQTLLGFQQLVQLFALQAEGRSLRQRLRLPEEIKNRYLLQCSPPEVGSFIVKVRVGGANADLITPVQVGQVMGKLHGFSAAAVRGQRDTLLDLVPDSRFRFRMLDSLGKLAPAAGSGYRISFRNCVGETIQLEEDLPGRIVDLLKPPAERHATQTITGMLDEISFSEHKLQIIYAPRNKTLECFYEEDLEPMLFENRRDLIQVTGHVIMDDENHPKKIVEVEAIRELDLSPFNLAEVVGQSLTVRWRKPLSLVPLLSDTQQLLFLEHAPLDIDVFAPTRADLQAELKEQVLMLAEEFALANDADLSQPARELKHRLLQEWEIVQHA
jgi:hypothetical protein